MNTLTAKDYYELSYDVIPDNKIQQVLGTYNYTQWLDNTIDEKVTEVKNIKRTETTTKLPIFSTSDQSTTSNYFYNVFPHNEYSGNAPESGVKYGSLIYRNEQIITTLYLDIYNDNPMSYEPTEESQVTISSAEGTKRIRTSTSGAYSSFGWATNFTNNAKYVYGIINYNLGGYSSTKSESTDIDLPTVISTTVDSKWQGRTIDRDVNKYHLKLAISFNVYNAHMEYQAIGTIGSITLNASMYYNLYSSITVSVPYKVRSDEQTADFSYNTDDKDYSSYSLTVTGNEFTSNATGVLFDEYEKLVVGSDNKYVTFDGNRVQMRLLSNIKTVQWPEWVSQQIMSKYRYGKLYITAKMSLKTAIKYSMDIDSIFTIKDLNNHLLRKYDHGYLFTCTFKIKSIEYECTEAGYNAIIVFLEDEGIAEELYVVNSKSEYITESNNNKLVYKKED